MTDLILQECIKDRKQSFLHTTMNFYKRNAIDLVLKYILLLMNSFGCKESSENGIFIFVDEVKNKNMINNLKNTQNVFEKNQKHIKRLCMYKLDSDKHIKLGYLTPIFCGIVFVFRLIVFGVQSVLSGKPLSEGIMKSLIISFDKYLDKIDKDVKDYLMMTDHHFYSSIIALREKTSCSVIQHGLVMNDYFFYPIRATRIFAWWNRSAELLNFDEKVCIAGTYKFDTLKKFNDKEQFSTLLFCISSLDNDVVKEKIDCLYNITKKYGYKLDVKCHSGSMFKKDYWETLYSDKNIVFYQEEIIDEINFDLAIVENSTIILDLLVMNKPFILFDNIRNYFERYENLLPHGEDEIEIEKCIREIKKYDFKEINKIMGNEELNNYKCSIFEKECEIFE